MSMNEELQSANEELETSKEEQQSINEELTTVNSQLNEKVLALSNANNDLANLFNATRVATIFLDTDLRVKRFTPRATDLLNLIESDLGRPIEHISQRFDHVHVTESARNVLTDLVPIEQEIRSTGGEWFTMRIFPYRTIDNRIEGVVITFNDVTRLKRAEAYAEAVMSMVAHPLVVLDRELRVVTANAVFCREFGYAPDDVRGRPLLDLDDGRWRAARAALEEALDTWQIRRDLELELLTSDGGEPRHLSMDVMPLNEDQAGATLLLTIQRRQAE
jgi:two-component system CheB/CheR fusion protein